MTALKQKKTLTLNVISPVHIGTREGFLRQTEFIFAGNRTFLVDEDRLGEYLFNAGLLPALVQAVQQGPFSLADFLASQGQKPAEIAPRIANLAVPGGGKDMQQFRPFVRDGRGRLFIPGSAIKGALRTAVLYRLVRDQDMLAKVRQKLTSDPPCSKDGGQNRTKKTKPADYSHDLLQRRGLQAYSLPPCQGEPHTDLFRCLTVRDAYPLTDTEVKTHIVPVWFLSLGKDNRFYFSQKKRGSGDLLIWLEAVIAGKFTVDLYWDNHLFRELQKNNRNRKFPMNNLDEVLQAVYDMNQAVIDHEIQHFGRSPAPTGASLQTALQQAGAADKAALTRGKILTWYQARKQHYLRLGFGSGMLSTTIGLHLPLELRQRVRDNCGSGKRPGDMAPKSRRVVIGGENFIAPLGWLQVMEGR